MTSFVQEHMTACVRSASRLWSGCMVPTNPFAGLAVEGEHGRVLRCTAPSAPTTALLAGVLLTRGKFYYEVTLSYNTSAAGASPLSRSASTVSPHHAAPAAASSTALSTKQKQFGRKRGGARAQPSCAIGWVDVEFVDRASNDATAAVGSDAHSWGYDPIAAVLKHGAAVEWGESAASGSVIGVAVDLDLSIMSFAVNGEWDGSASVAFNNVAFRAGLVPALTLAQGGDLAVS